MFHPTKVIGVLLSIYLTINGLVILLNFSNISASYVRFYLGAFFAFIWFVFLIGHNINYIRRIINIFYNLKNYLRRIIYQNFIAKIYRNRPLGLMYYKEDIERNIRTSRNIYFLFITAETIFFDPRERFIIKALQSLPPASIREKNIRVKLRFPQGEAFWGRAAWFRERLQSDPDAVWAPMTQEEHRKRILAVAPRLEEIIHMGIEYYNSEPLWRLMIFDEAVYIASYLDKDGERLEGLFSSVTRIPVDTSVYNGFLMHFDRLQ